MSKAVRIHHGLFGRVAILDFDRPLVPHAHSQCHVLIKIGGADTIFGVRDEVHPLSDDRAVLVNTWEPHSYPHPPGNTRSVILAIYIEPLWLALHRGGGSQAPRFTQSSVAVSSAIRRVANLLAAELVYGDGFDVMFVEQAIGELMAEFEPANDTASGPCEEDLDRRIRRTLGFMREHLDARVELGDLASVVGLSRPHFFELFRRELHMTPNLYWNTLRMEHAVGRLADERVPVSDVAYSLGFTAQSNFTRFFRDIQGVCPREYQLAVARLRPEPEPAAAR
jgi:AraC-like DNA-binding protein